MTLVPVIWKHTMTADIGYQITDVVSVDGYVAYAFGENESRNSATIDTLAAAPFGAASVETEYKANIDAEVMAGIGINIALP